MEGLNQDGIAVAVVGKHDVLVATARADGESSHIVRVEFADGFDIDMEFVGWCGGGEGRLGRLGLGGS